MAGHASAVTVSRVVDGALGLLGRLARRRSRAGEPVWYLVIAGVWMVNRARRQRHAVLWRGTVDAGQVLTVQVGDGPARRAG
jgi:hypothetical protein